MYKSSQLIRATGGSAEQLLLGPNGKRLLISPSHILQIKLCEGVLVSNGRLITAVLRKIPERKALEAAKALISWGKT